MAAASRPVKLSLAATLLAIGGVLAAFGFNAWRDNHDPVLATVNDTTLRLSDVYRRVNALSLGDQIDVRQELERFTRSVIDEEILFQYGLNGDDALRAEVKAAVVEHLIDRFVKAKIEVSEADVERYYRDHLDEIRGEHLHVYQIQLAERRECERLQPQIDSLARFTELARSRSINPGLAARGGDMGYIMRHFDLLGFEAELFGLPLHQVHLLENADGCYLIWLDEYLDPPPPPLAEVAPNLRLRLERIREIELLQALLERAATAVGVERYPLPPAGG